MKTAGALLSIVAVVIAILGILAGVLSYASAKGESSGLALIAASIVTGIVLYGLGTALEGLQDIVDETRRTALAAERGAEAMEYLARRQRESDRKHKAEVSGNSVT